MQTDSYGYDQYLVRRKLLSLFGAKFHIFSNDGKLLFFSLMIEGKQN